MSAEALRLARLLLDGDLDAARSLAERISSRHDAARQTRLDRTRRRRLDAARQTQQEAAGRVELRGAALERERGRCALVRLAGSPCGGALHMHHVVGRHDERLATVAMLCFEHHEGRFGVHGSHPERALRALASYCELHDMLDAQAAVLRRILGLTPAP